MLRSSYVRVALVVLVCIAAGWYCTAAEPKGAPIADTPNAKARIDAARKAYEWVLQQYRAEPNSVVIEAGSFRDWSVRWLQAELSQKKADEIAALEGHLERMQLWKEMCDAGVKNGTATRISTSVTEFFRLEAEDWLGAAKAEAEKQ
jgi:hypothetical protein